MAKTKLRHRSRPSESVAPVDETPATPTSSAPAPTEKPKSGSRWALALWGIPLVIFIIIAILKELF